MKLKYQRSSHITGLSRTRMLCSSLLCFPANRKSSSTSLARYPRFLQDNHDHDQNSSRNRNSTLKRKFVNRQSSIVTGPLHHTQVADGVESSNVLSLDPRKSRQNVKQVLMRNAKDWGPTPEKESPRRFLLSPCTEPGSMRACVCVCVCVDSYIRAIHHTQRISWPPPRAQVKIGPCLPFSHCRSVARSGTRISTTIPRLVFPIRWKIGQLKQVKA